ncbi:hypothetical protein N599_33470, partial [Saccharopolyspora erythraea D]
MSTSVETGRTSKPISRSVASSSGETAAAITGLRITGPRCPPGAAVNRTPSRSAAACRAAAGTTTVPSSRRCSANPSPSRSLTARTSLPSSSRISRSCPGAASTPPVGAATATGVVGTRGASVRETSTEAPHSSRWLQPEMSYSRGTSAEMSAPSARIT